MISRGLAKLQTVLCCAAMLAGCQRKQAPSAGTATTTPAATGSRATAATDAMPESATSAAITSRTRLEESTKNGSALVAERFISEACVRQASGKVLCWQKRDVPHTKAQVEPLVPVVVPELEGAADLGSGDVFSYIVKDDGSVWTWGVADNQDHRFKYVVFEDASTPKPFLEPGRAAQLGSYGNAVLVRDRNGTISYWEESYQIDEDHIYTGYVRGQPRAWPSLPPALALADSCTISKAGRVYCIGWGAGTAKAKWVPDISDAVSLVMCRIQKGCVLRKNDSVQCWTEGDDGFIPEVLPDAPPTASLSCDDRGVYLVARDGTVRFATFAVGGTKSRLVKATHLAQVAELRGSCVLQRNGGVACWDPQNSLGSGTWEQPYSELWDARVGLLHIGVTPRSNTKTSSTPRTTEPLSH